MGLTKSRYKEIDINDYISDAALNGIYALENHHKTEVVDKPTTLYGLTDNAIKEVHGLLKKGIALPPEIMNIKNLDDYDKATKMKDGKNNDTGQARLLTGYYAYYLTTEADRLTNGKFSELDNHTKDVLLSYFHNTGLGKAGKNIDTKGSVLGAVRDGLDKHEIAKRILSNNSGDLLPANKIDGQYKRRMATVEWLYNPDSKITSLERLPDGLKDAEGNKVYPTIKRKDGSVYHKSYLDYRYEDYAKDGYLGAMIHSINLMQQIDYRNNIRHWDDVDRTHTEEKMEPRIKADVFNREPKKEKESDDGFWKKFGKTLGDTMTSIFSNGIVNNKEIDNNPSNSLNNVEGKTNGNQNNNLQ